MKPLICADCKWYIVNMSSTSVANFDKCQASEKINLVTGDSNYSYCESMRNPSGDCGMEGKLFELNEDTQND